MVMKYFEWDRLRLQKRFNPGIRPAKQTVTFELFRMKNRKEKIIWNAILHKNAAFFYGKSTAQLHITLKEIAKQSSKKFSGSAHIDFYEFDNKTEQIGEQLEKDYKSFSYHHYKDSQEQFLDDLINFRSMIDEEMIAHKHTEAYYRKLHIILVRSDDENIVNNNKMKDLMNNSYWQRMFVIPLVPYAEKVDLDVHNFLQWSAYLGSDNDNYAHDVLHTEMQDSDFDPRQNVVGCVYAHNISLLMLAHSHVYTLSKAAIQEDERFDEEDRIYQEFLESLNDGTAQE